MAIPSDPAAQLLMRQVTFNAPQQSASFTASIAGTVLTVTAVASGVIAAGQQLSGAGIAPGTYIVGADIPNGVPTVGGGGTPTGSGGSAQGTSTSTGVTTGISGTANSLMGNPFTTGQQALTGTGGVGTYLLNTPYSIASEAMTSATAQSNTGPSGVVNANPVSGARTDTTATANPGAVGSLALAAPYAAVAVANGNQVNVAGVTNPVIPLPSTGNEQVTEGNSVINRAQPQWAIGGEAGFVTAKQG